VAHCLHTNQIQLSKASAVGLAATCQNPRLNTEANLAARFFENSMPHCMTYKLAVQAPLQLARLQLRTPNNCVGLATAHLAALRLQEPWHPCGSRNPGIHNAAHTPPYKPAAMRTASLSLHTPRHLCSSPFNHARMPNQGAQRVIWEGSKKPRAPGKLVALRRDIDWHVVRLGRHGYLVGAQLVDHAAVLNHRLSPH
jgi:hypothetical protein